MNADIKYHYRNKPGGEFVVMGSDTATVGTHISTKAVGKEVREDITLQYKYPEGSAAERAALKGSSPTSDDNPLKNFKFAAKLASGRELGTNLMFEVNFSSTSAAEGEG